MPGGVAELYSSVVKQVRFAISAMQIQSKCVLIFKQMMSVICQKECVSLPMSATGMSVAGNFCLVRPFTCL